MEEDKTEVNADYSKGLIMKKKKQKNSKITEDYLRQKGFY